MDKYPLLREQVEKIVVQHGRKGEAKSKDQVLILKCKLLGAMVDAVRTCCRGLQFAFFFSPGWSHFVGQDTWLLGSIGAFTKNLLLTAVSSILLCRLKHLLTWNWLISTQIILILLVMQSKSILFYCLKWHWALWLLWCGQKQCS